MRGGSNLGVFIHDFCSVYTQKVLVANELYNLLFVGDIKMCSLTSFLSFVGNPFVKNYVNLLAPLR